MSTVDAGAVVAVTVFRDRALVMRRLTTDLQAGENIVRFSGLGSGIFEESIRPRFTAGAVTLSAVTLEHKLLWQYRSEEHQRVWLAARNLVMQHAEILDNKVVFGLENRIISELREYLQLSLNSILLEQEISITKLKEALLFLEQRNVQNTGKLIALDQDYVQLDRDMALIQEQLSAISRLDQREENSIAVTLESTEQTSIDLEVSYLIPGASWRPEYDCVLDQVAATLVVKYCGAIQQTTGEAWENAAISLSTAAPELSPQIPEVYPLSVSSVYQKRSRNIVVEGQAVQDLGESIPEAAMDSEDWDAGSGQTVLADEPSQATVAAVFPVLAGANIASDGLWHRVVIFEQSFVPQTTYECVPELLEYVYVKAAFTNNSGFPLLAGVNNLYRNGSYVGQSMLDYAAAGEKVQLSFGIDDDIRVKRNVLADYHEPSQNVLAKNQFHKYFEFVLSNFKSVELVLVLKEAVYVSDLKELEIVMHEDTTPGYTMDKAGIISWICTVPPASTCAQACVLRYRIESPRNFDLSTMMR